MLLEKASLAMKVINKILNECCGKHVLENEQNPQLSSNITDTWFLLIIISASTIEVHKI